MNTAMKITLDTITDAGHDADQSAMIRALCAFLDCEPSDLSANRHDHYGLAVFSLGSKEYAIGTDSEADAAARANIKDSAWAFTPSFLSGYCDLPEDVFACLQSKCEDSNEAVLSLIEKSGGFEDFAAQAISADGRGHFMSSYDGDENEQTGEREDGTQERFYIYRTN